MGCKSCEEKNRKKLGNIIITEIKEVKQKLENGRISKKEYISMINSILAKYNIKK